ncbi:MAG: PhoH family protein, partial [Alphaproteobacteria bacterium]
MKDKNGKGKNGKGDAATINIVFEDNALLPMLYGDNDAHLTRLEKHFDVEVSSRGNVLAIKGSEQHVGQVRNVLESLYADLQKGAQVEMEQVDVAIRLHGGGNGKREETGVPSGFDDVFIKTLKKTVKPYSAMQAEYIKSLGRNDLVFALGPAGTGKTYLAVAMAVAMFNSGKVEKIVLSRPAVEAGEKLGFLPGDLKEKVDPYLRPLYDALFDMMPGERLTRYMENGEIEVAPLAFMRGRTFSNSFIILDEAQNT